MINQWPIEIWLESRLGFTPSKPFFNKQAPAKKTNGTMKTNPNMKSKNDETKPFRWSMTTDWSVCLMQ